MAIANVQGVVSAQIEGRSRTSDWVKNVSQVTTVGLWYDISGASGNPIAKQWFDAAPLTAQQVKLSTDGGLFHGRDVSTQSKYLRSIKAFCASATPLPMQMILCDYLLYYPTVDESVTNPQTMTNTLALPRYTTGAGVQAMAVVITGGAGGQTFSFSYTNQDGTAGRTSGTVTMTASTALGTVLTSARASAGTIPSPFIPLQGTDTGIRSIDSITMNGADTGFFALVLVQPLATLSLCGIDAPYEKDFLMFASDMPQIQDDAYLSFLVQPNGSLSGLALRGNIRTIWG